MTSANHARPPWSPAVFALVTAVALIGCSTGYKSMGLKGGFSETRLSDDSYQVRYGANIFTNPDKVAQLLLRRAAELCLEHGKQYFVITSQQDTARGATGPFGPTTVPSGQLTFRILEAEDESPDAVDALVVIDQTNAAAKGRLSDRAAETYRRLKVVVP